jgi:hypothetical protein
MIKIYAPGRVMNDGRRELLLIASKGKLKRTTVQRYLGSLVLEVDLCFVWDGTDELRELRAEFNL